jgi:hypothetical protein
VGKTIALQSRGSIACSNPHGCEYLPRRKVNLDLQISQSLKKHNSLCLQIRNILRIYLNRAFIFVYISLRLICNFTISTG